MPPHSDRIAWLDTAKVIASVLVIYAHLKVSNIWWLETINHSLLFYSHVPFFFIVSAYFLAKSLTNTNNQCRYIRKRLKLLIIPFLFYNMSLDILGNHGGVFAAFVSWDTEKILSSLKGIIGLGRLPYDVPLHFLRDLLLYIFLSPFIIKIPKSYLWCICIILFSIPFVITQNVYLSYPNTEYTGFFIMGLCLAKSGLNIRNFPTKMLASPGISGLTVLFNIFIITILINNHVYNESTTYWMFMNVPAKFIGILGLLSISCFLCHKLPKINSLLSKYGTDTFFVYVAHYPVIYAITVFHQYALKKGFSMPDSLIYIFTEISPVFIFIFLVSAIHLIRKKIPFFSKFIDIGS